MGGRRGDWRLDWPRWRGVQGSARWALVWFGAVCGSLAPACSSRPPDFQGRDTTSLLDQSVGATQADGREEQEQNLAEPDPDTTQGSAAPGTEPDVGGGGEEVSEGGGDPDVVEVSAGPDEPVEQLQPPEVGMFEASPSSLPGGGGSVTLSWRLSGEAESFTLEPGGGAVGHSSHTVDISSTTTFVLRVENEAGFDESELRVEVSAAGELAFQQGIVAGGVALAGAPVGGVVVVGSRQDGDAVAGYAGRYRADGSPASTLRLGAALAADARVGGVSMDSSGYAFVAAAVPGSGPDGALAPDIAVEYFSPEGASLWSDRFGSEGVEDVRGTASGEDGVYVTGLTLGDLVLGASYGSDYDVFLARYSTNGARQWIRQLGTWESDIPREVAVGVEGEAYVVGDTTGDLPGATSAGGSDAFVAKYLPSGELHWVRLLGTAEFESAQGVGVAPDGSVWVGGHTTGALFGPAGSASTPFVAKFSPEGERLLGVQASATSAQVYGLAVDGNGHAFAVTSSNQVMKFHVETGDLLWAVPFTIGGNSFPFGIAADSSNSVFVTGIGATGPYLVGIR